MPRYIDAEKIRLVTQATYDGDGEILVPFRDVVRAVQQTPIEDVVPVVHGRWEYVDVDIVCSVCGGDGVMPWNKYTQEKFPYCSHCGAKMDGEKAEE